MYLVVSILILVVSVLLMIVVLVQNSKGGGLASNFASSNQYLGVRQTTDFVEKATWTLAGVLLVLCLVSAVSVGNGRSRNVNSEQILPTIEQTSVPSEIPTIPMAE